RPGRARRAWRTGGRASPASDRGRSGGGRPWQSGLRCGRSRLRARGWSCRPPARPRARRTSRRRPPGRRTRGRRGADRDSGRWYRDRAARRARARVRGVLEPSTGVPRAFPGPLALACGGLWAAGSTGAVAPRLALAAAPTTALALAALVPVLVTLDPTTPVAAAAALGQAEVGERAPVLERAAVEIPGLDREAEEQQRVVEVLALDQRGLAPALAARVDHPAVSHEDLPRALAVAAGDTERR